MSETDSKEIRKYLQQSHDKIFESNRKWAEEQKAKNPEFFEKLSAGQSPEYLWIGTSIRLHVLLAALFCRPQQHGTLPRCSQIYAMEITKYI
jgi:hypothetical protein